MMCEVKVGLNLRAFDHVLLECVFLIVGDKGVALLILSRSVINRRL